jgi:hypothetical protein
MQGRKEKAGVESNFHKKLAEFQEKVAQLNLIEQAGLNPQLLLATLQFQNGKFVLPRRAQEQLLDCALFNLTQPYRPPPPSEEALIFGDIPIPLNDAPNGILITGAPGTGKTNLELLLIDQFQQKGIFTQFWDFKGEGRRFPDYWRSAMVFSAQNAPWQWLEPPHGCDPLTYGTGVISELRTELDMHSATFPLVWQIWERTVRGLKPGDPYPSISDFRRILEHEAEAENRENLHTAARIFLSIETVLGPNARVRKAPDISTRYTVAALELFGQDPKIFRLFVGLHFNKTLLKAQQEEHTTDLRAVEIIDEAAPLCSIELASRGVANLSSLKRFITMARFMGTALIIGCQNVSQIDPFVKNCGTIVVFRTPSVSDALDAAKMLGLPLDATEELMRLKRGEAYMRSIGWEQAVRIQVPLFAK